jgi:hypothetical protein
MDIFRRTDKGIEYGDRPVQIQPTTPLTHKILRGVLYAIVFLCISAGAAVAMIEFAAGCGEVTYHADRTWTTNQCVFLNTKQASGTW